MVNSYDPNDKICLEGEIEAPSKIGEYLHYIINFENVGSADAVNIVVKDVIDVTKFDEKTLQILDSSHPVRAKINSNIAEFIFEGINLQHGGHGNILLKIKTRDNLVVGDVVTNKADIFFDYNLPITTNLASTTFQALGIDDHRVGIRSCDLSESYQWFSFRKSKQYYSFGATVRCTGKNFADENFRRSE